MPQLSKMRFDPEPVKLRIANVRRLPDLMRERPSHHPRTSKNTTKINIFATIAPFQRNPDVASGQIDENGSLPYKPRQLSAMTRSDRGRLIWAGNGPFWAGQHHRTYLNYQAKLPGQRRTTREADLST
jgi:hypothetical protein